LPSEKLNCDAGIACSAAAIVVSSSAIGPSAKFSPTTTGTPLSRARQPSVVQKEGGMT
jgi:hypothetical protein